jgi:hypothetical protein
LLAFAESIEAINSFVSGLLQLNNPHMNKQHPAIAAYEALRKQEPNVALLHFALIQQAWLEMRGVPEQRPSEYAMVLLRAMAYAFLLSQGFSEREVRDQLIEGMETFEKQFRALAESSIVKGGEPPMRRTRPAGNVVRLFPQGGSKKTQ